MSVPYAPRGDVDVLSELTSQLGPRNYQAFFQEPGIAEAVLQADVRASVLAGLVRGSGDAASVDTLGDVSAETFVPDLAGTVPPAWLTDDDVDYYAAEYQRTGYRGGLNWYRNSERNWELMAPWHRAPLLSPSLFVGGERDPVLHWPGFRWLLPRLARTTMPGLTKAVVLEGCGHWIQQERPGEVSALLLEFLAGLPA